MIDWTIHKFVLAWIKNNLDGYLFLTPDATQIKAQMDKNTLETDDEIRQFGELYEQFLAMFEANPLTRLNEKGEQASILAADFYFYIFPTKQDIYIPIGLQIEMGVTDSAEKAKTFRGRLQMRLNAWKREAEEKNAKIKEAGPIYSDLNFQQLMRKSPPFFVYLICQILVAAMAAICLKGTYSSFGDSLMSLTYHPTLAGIAQVSVAVVSLFYLLKSVFWVLREKKRQRYLKAWKAKLKLQIQAEKAESVPVAVGFRTAELLGSILDSIEAQTYHRPETISSAVPQGSIQKDAPDVNLEDMQDVTKRKIFYTARPVHVLAMLMVMCCFLTYVGDGVPAAVGTLKVQAQEKLDDILIVLDEMMTDSDDIDAARSSVNMRLVVTADTLTGYRSAELTEANATFENSTALNMYGCVKNSEGSLYYLVANEEGQASYVSAEGVTLRAANSVTVLSVRLYGKDGQEKDASQLGYLFDGSALTSATLEKGDVIQMTFAETVSPSGFYFVNGSMTDEGEAAAGVRLAYLNMADEETYRLLFDKDCSVNGYSVALPDAAMNELYFQIVSTTDGSDSCCISEIIFCG